MEKGRIGLNAGKVWHALNEVNEISTQELSRKLSLSIEDLALAIGWLAREKQYLYHEKEWFVVCQQWHQIQYVLLEGNKKRLSITDSQSSLLTLNLIP